MPQRREEREADAWQAASEAISVESRRERQAITCGAAPMPLPMRVSGKG